MSESKPACRLQLLLACQADVAVVFRRGPTAWWHILRWNLADFTLEAGAWLKGSLYAARSAISPDGRYLAYYALHGDWGTYFAVSKTPWLKALCAWKTVGTWTTGAQFENDGRLRAFGAFESERPFHGDCPFPVEFSGVDTNWNRGKDFQLLANGWRPRKLDLPPEEYDPKPHEITELVKHSPQNSLLSLYRYAEFGSALYSLGYADRAERVLEEVVWADFDRHGRLVAATSGGEIKLLDLDGMARGASGAGGAGQAAGAVETGIAETLITHDLSALRPQPVEAPAWARQW